MADSDMTQEDYVDLLSDRKQSSDAAWATRYISFVKAYSDRAVATLTQTSIAQKVLSHPTILGLIQNADSNGLFKTQIPHAEVNAIIKEIAHMYRLPVIRWLGYLLIKVLKKTISGLYVNKKRLDEMKSAMGDCPVIFVPTHRSYADFILMAFICFDCDIDVPCVAAGMDFYSMWLMGNILRKCKAFFMRRSFVSDSLYRKIFEVYVEALITFGESPVEFFIEGTRSRTGKALWPKYGFLSMVSECFMNGGVSNLKFVPITFTYDRPLEEKLFAFELLGIPKPKESTKGLLKALSDLNQSYGNVIASFGCPIPARDFLPRAPRPHERISSDEFQSVKRLAFTIIAEQQAGQILTSTHLLAVSVLNNLFGNRSNSMTVESAIGQANRISVLFQRAGARIMFFKGDEESVLDAVKSNPRLYKLSDGKIVFLNVFELPALDENIKVKGSKLRDTTMSLSIPVLMLQNIINSTLHFVAWPAFFLTSVLIVESHSYSGPVRPVIALLGQIFQREFVLFRGAELDSVESLLLECSCLTKGSGDTYYLGTDVYVIALMLRLFLPYYSCYWNVASVLLKSCIAPMTMNEIVVQAQQRVENLAQNYQYELFYSFSIDTIVNCVKSFEDMKAINDIKSPSVKTYEGDEERLTQIVRLLSKASEIHRYPFQTEKKCNL